LKSLGFSLEQIGGALAKSSEWPAHRIVTLQMNGRCADCAT
jgi:hypothetical protein